MLQYIVRRLLIAIPILLAVVTLVFFVVRMAPGDPAQVILGDSASEESLTALRSTSVLPEGIHRNMQVDGMYI